MFSLKPLVGAIPVFSYSLTVFVRHFLFEFWTQRREVGGGAWPFIPERRVFKTEFELSVSTLVLVWPGNDEL